MLYIHLLAYLLLGLLLYPLIPSGVLRFVVSGIYLLFFFLDIAAIYAKGTHFSLSFAANIERKVIEMALTSFLPVTLSVLAMYVGLLVVIHFYDEQIIRFTSQEIFPHVILIAIILLLGFSKNGVFYNVFHTVKSLVITNSAHTLPEVSEDLHFQEQYIRADDLVSSAGKNVIIIYLESFDQNFLDEDLFPGLMPKLKKRIDEWTFYDYVPYKGIDYTMGALYGTQTGLPNYFGLQGNNVFANITSTQTSSIGQILDKAGYHQVYLNGGDLAFAGKGNFFQNNGYQTLGEADFDASLIRSEWGIHDGDLFEKAKELVKEYKDKDEPFNLTMLTLDLHFPDGLEHPDNIGKYNEGHGILNAAAALDDVLDDFLVYLEEEDLYKDTVVYIMGDHPLMGINSVTSKLSKEERNLFLLTNSEPTQSYPSAEEELYFYDIPKVILEGMKVKHNAKFLVDVIDELSYPFIDQHVGDFTTLNYLLHNFSAISDDLYVVEDGGKYVLRSGKYSLKSFVLKENEQLYYVINDAFKIVASFTKERGYDHILMDASYADHLLISFYLEQGSIQGVILNQQSEVYHYFGENEEVSKGKLHQYMKGLKKKSIVEEK